MTALVITPEKESEIKAAIVKARANVIPWAKTRHTAADADTFMLTLADRKPGSEKRPESVGVIFEGGVTAAISFEEQPAGIMRHVSFATGKPGKNHLMNPIVVAALCELFGIREFPPTHGKVWIEEYKPNHFAVNVIELEHEREAGHA